MALPNWNEIRKELLKGQVTYEKLYLNGWTKTLPEPTPVGERLPDWLTYAFRPYSEEVRRAHRIDVSRDEASCTVRIVVHCEGGRTYGLNIPDEALIRNGLDLTALAPTVSLPVVRSPHPILGWRQWELKDTPKAEDKLPGMYGLWGMRWETPLLQAICTKIPSHSAPVEDCRCGIYFHEHPSFSDSDDGGRFVKGIVVSTNVIQHEYGYRAGLVRCIAISGVHPQAHGWDGIPILPGIRLGKYITELRENPSLIPYPDDIPAP